MHNLLNSFLKYSSEEKWKAWREFQPYLQGRDTGFDYIFEFINDFHKEFDKFPTWDVLDLEIQATNSLEAQKLVTQVKNATDLKDFITEADFCGYLKILERFLFEGDLYTNISDFQQKIAGMTDKSVGQISQEVQELVQNLHSTHGKVVKTEKSNSGIIYGPEAVQEFVSIYEELEKKKASGENLFYDFGFSKFSDVKMKSGDLIIIGGHTSQGKSVWARYLAYRFLVEYGLNVLYISMEMKYDTQLASFQILHANNPKIFKNAPKISNTKFKEASLSSSERDFLLNCACPDLANNQAYGTLMIEQPNKSRFRVSDIRERLIELESTRMPVEVLVIDYATMLYPMESERRQPEREDYNLMIKEIKSLAMTHRDRAGMLKPLIVITPAQISRDHFEEAVKNDGKYDITCLRQYSELEMSADILVTTLLTENHRLNQQIRLQNIKNRDGAVVIDPIDLSIDLDHGFLPKEGFTRTPEDTIKALHATLNF